MNTILRTMTVLAFVTVLAPTVFAESADVTFQVKMSVKMLEGTFRPSSGDIVTVRGSFNNWGFEPPGNVDILEDSDGDSIYTKTIALGIGGIQYKFWKTTRGGIDWEGDPNRDYTVVSGAQSIPVVYFDRDEIVNVAEPPTITSLSPSSGAVGSSVTITGTNFDPTPTNNIVYFGAVRGSVTSASTTSMTVTVPAGATYAPITVTTGGLTAYSNSPFIVTFSSSRSIDARAFAAKSDSATYGKANELVVGDLDGDGKPDVVVASSDSPAITLFRNTSTSGSIAFAPSVRLDAGFSPWAPSLGDIDGDGKLDLVCEGAANAVSVFRNTSTLGSISFAARLTFSAGNGVRRATIRDYDGDGRPDLALANMDVDSVSVLRNVSTIGNISFESKVTFTTGDGPFYVIADDVDGDAKPDLVVTNLNGASVSILRNTSTVGNIAFAAKVDFATGTNPKNGELGDIDGDGKLDLAVPNSVSNTVTLLRNTSTPGSISFASSSDLASIATPNRAAMGDIDGDGKPDLAVSSTGDNWVSVFRNTSSVGSISFSSRSNYSTGLNPRDVSIGDIDGDAQPDLVTTNLNAQSISILRNTLTPQVVTFQVNMKVKILESMFLPTAGDVVTVPGSFNGWNTSADTLTDLDSDSIYTKSIANLSTGPILYKFFKTLRGGVNWEGDPNRDYTVVSGAQSVPVVHFDRDEIVNVVDPPTLVAPSSGASGILLPVTLMWNPSSGAQSYRVQVSTAPDFSESEVVLNLGGVNGTQLASTGLSGTTTYYWRVNASNAGGASAWSSVWSFTSQVVLPPPTSSKWQFVRVFFNSVGGSSGIHGIAVDPEGKVWITPYGNSDSVWTGSGYRRTRAVYVFYPNGTQVSFSPIKMITVGSTTDTLYNSSRGLAVDHNGNILHSSFDALYRINYRTGQGMSKVVPQTNTTLTASASDTLGNIFVGKVLPGNPIQVFDPSFNPQGNVSSASTGFSRTMSVSKDGKDVYWPEYSNRMLYLYHSDNGAVGPYAKNDSALGGLAIESSTRHPRTGLIWVSSGSNENPPIPPWTKQTWYAFDPSTKQVVDTIGWNSISGTENLRPRGIAFSPTGDTAYVGCFLNDGPVVQMFVRQGISVNVGSAYLKNRSLVRVLDADPVRPDAIPAAYSITGSAITVEAWIFPIRFPAPPGSDIILSRPSPGSPVGGFDLAIRDSSHVGEPRLSFRVSLGDTHLVVRDVALAQLGVWQHVAGTYDGTTAKLYINGSLVASASLSRSIAAGQQGFFIGGINTPNAFHGLIDEVRLWNVARSQSDIQTYKDSTLNGNETGLAGYWPLEGATTVNGKYPITIDRTANHNDLWAIQDAEFVSLPEGSVVALPPEFIPGDQPEATVGAPFSYRPSTGGWPVPTVSFVYGPIGMTINPSTGYVSWIPSPTQVGFNQMRFHAANAMGDAESNYTILVNALPTTWRTHNNSAVTLHLANNGMLGRDSSSSGFLFNEKNGLYEATVIVGHSSSQVSGSLYAHEFAVQDTFRSIVSYLNGFDQAFETKFTDQRVSNPMGIQIVQRSHSKSTNPDRNFVVLDYEIVNNSGANLTGVYVGLAADFDVGDAPSNLTGFDAARSLLYTFQVGNVSNPNYYGMLPLKGAASGYGAWIGSGQLDRSDSAYFAKLTTTVAVPASPPGDYREIVGTGTYTIPAGGSVRVMFALVAGSNLGELQSAADAARAVQFRPEPTLLSIRDVGNDQGGRVTLRWNASSLDNLIHNLPYYSIWRSLPEGALLPTKQTLSISDAQEATRFEASGTRKMSDDLVAMTPKHRFQTIDGVNYAWEWIADQPAHRFTAYSYTAPTLYDSMSSTNGRHYFLVSAQTSDPFVYYDSNVDSGYSVDNLSPSTPLHAGLTSLAANKVQLTWDRNWIDPDVAWYQVYRDTTSGFLCADSTRFYNTTDTTLVDSSLQSRLSYYYRVVAVDIHGNESPPTSELLSPSALTSRADIRVLLEGPYNSGTLQMNKSLKTGGYLAAHFGSIPIPSEAVDSITIELRNAASSPTTRKYRPAWLLTDGTIRDFIDTTRNYVEFDTLAGSYFLVVRHRNHLPVMTAATQVLNGAVPSPYDFTTGTDKYYGTDARALGAGVFGMYAADVTGDGRIILAAELTTIRANNLQARYDNADVNLDGRVILATELTIVRANNLRMTNVP